MSILDIDLNSKKTTYIHIDGHSLNNNVCDTLLFEDYTGNTNRVPAYKIADAFSCCCDDIAAECDRIINIPEDEDIEALTERDMLLYSASLVDIA